MGVGEWHPNTAIADRKEPAYVTIAADAYLPGEGACAKPAPYFSGRMTIALPLPGPCAVAP
jgi:hypothetical protein